MQQDHNETPSRNVAGRHAATDFDQVIDRRETSSTKWNKFGSQVLPFWVADMDFAAPDFILDALRQRIDHGIVGYTQTPNSLIEATLEWLQRSFGWEVSPHWLVWLPGVVTGLNLACRAAGRSGDSVMMNTPVYYPFLAAPGHGERRSIEVPLALNEALDGAEWVIDFDAMGAAATKDTRMFMLCNPQNPTGRCYRADELKALAEFCAARDMLICSDEIHCSLLLDDHAMHLPIATLDDAIAQRTITLMAPTKTYNTPGLSCAFAVIPNASLRRRFVDARAGLVPGVGPLAYLAADAAYRDSTDWVPQLRAYLGGNRDLLEQRVAGLAGIRMTHVQATYLAWLDVRDLPVDSVASHFESHGLGLSDGAQFHGDGYMRFNFGCPRSTLEAGLTRLETAIQSLTDTGP